MVKKFDLKNLVIDGDEFASLCHWQSPNGKLVIDVSGNTLKPGEARKLGKWLLKAADIVAKENRLHAQGDK